jgi:tetratricopeptide (TPR) repeat protein
MAKKLTREELKRDEVLETVGRGFRFVTSHKKGATEAIVVSAILVVLAGAFLAFRSYRETQAAGHLSRALDILSTPLAGDPGAAGAPKTYATAAERNAAAEKELKDAAAFSATRAGSEARLIQIAKGTASGNSESFLDRYSRGGRGILSTISEINAARLLASQGKNSEAIARLKRALESSEPAMPKDVLLIELAHLYEKAGFPADAKSTYQRIISEYPDSLYRSDAQSKIGAL